MNDATILGIWWWWATIGLVTSAVAVWLMWRGSWPYVLDAIDIGRDAIFPPALLIVLLTVGSAALMFFSIPLGPVLTVMTAVTWGANRLVANRRAHLERKRQTGNTLPWKEGNR